MSPIHPSRGIIFDFDGVIVLSEPVHARAWKDLEEDFGHELPEGFIDRGIGHSDAELCDQLAGHWNNGTTGDALLELKRRRYRERARHECKLVEGIREALELLADRYPLAVATSSSRGDIDPLLDSFDLESFFAEVLTIESVENPKPHPEIYLRAAQRLDRRPEECWVFEDSIQGARSGRAAGARVIGITTTYDAENLAPVWGTFADYTDREALLALLES